MKGRNVDSAFLASQPPPNIAAIGCMCCAIKYKRDRWAHVYDHASDDEQKQFLRILRAPAPPPPPPPVKKESSWTFD